MKKLIALILSAIMVVSLAACGSSGGGNTATTAAPAPETTAAAPEETTAAAGGEETTEASGEETSAVEEAQTAALIEVASPNITASNHSWFRSDYQVYKSNLPGTISGAGKDTIVYACSAGISKADPNTYSNEFPWSENVYEPLFSKDMTGESDDYIPLLATEWGYNDNDEFEITLRDGVKFHDGTTLDGEDVLFTLQRVANAPGNKAAVSMRKINFEKSSADGLHVTLVFDQPVGSLLNDLSCGYTGIMSKEYFDNNPEATLLDSDAGTGAYTLVETVSGVSQTFDAFEDYWGGAPKVKHVIYKLYKDYSVMAIDFMNGDLDLGVNFTYGTVSDFLDDKLPGVTMYSVPSRSIFMDVATRGDVVFADKKLRQALAYAIDYDGLIDAVYQDHMMATTTNSTFIPGTKYEKDMGVIPYDPQKAMDLLAECGYSLDNPCHVKMLSTNSTFGQATATIIQAFGSLVGFDIELDIVDSAGASAIVDSPVVPCAYDLYVCTNQFNTGSPETLIGDRVTFNGTEDLSCIQGIEDEKFNELAEKAFNSIDEAEREELYSEIQDLLYDNFWTIQISSFNSIVMAQPYVGEVQFQSGYQPFWKSFEIIE